MLVEKPNIRLTSKNKQAILMFEPHQGNVRIDCDFDKVWDSLKIKGELSLQTEIEGNPFIAKATVATKGLHSGEKVIVFFTKRTESELNLQEGTNAAGDIIITVMEPELECTLKHWFTQ
ncbi:MAG: hypothetical protein ACXV2C_01000 [Candidatus Bathyarchaeia archaeon]